MIRGMLFHRWNRHSALVGGYRASSMEHTPGRRIAWARDIAFQNNSFPASLQRPVRQRNGGQQGLCVWMKRIVVKGLVV